MNLRYWISAGQALARNCRRTPGFAKDLATAGLRFDLEPKAPTLELLEAYPELAGAEVDLGKVTFRRSNLDPLEQFTLAGLARLRAPARIFEIGTYDGATTLLLARNAPTAEVITLDLHPDAADAATVEGEFENARRGVGFRFRGIPEAERITQLLGDSRSFDFGPWAGSVDLVLVDAGHEYDYVKRDTTNALRLLSPRGIIVWDDYQIGWPGVVRAVEEAGVPVFRIAGTDFAVYESAR